MKEIFSIIFALLQPSGPKIAAEGGINQFVQPAADFVDSVVFFSISLNAETKLPLVLILLILGAVFLPSFLNSPTSAIFAWP